MSLVIIFKPAKNWISLKQNEGRGAKRKYLKVLEDDKGRHCLPCPFCQKLFPLQTYQRHVDSHEKKFQCPVCVDLKGNPISYKRQCSLKRHFCEKHGDRCYICSCGKRYQRKADMDFCRKQICKKKGFFHHICLNKEEGCELCDMGIPYIKLYRHIDATELGNESISTFINTQHKRRKTRKFDEV
tara:strand:- start:44 stop:598 length:555 start_codon:yes stop_codon:yes gene_type:complete